MNTKSKKIIVILISVITSVIIFGTIFWGIFDKKYTYPLSKRTKRDVNRPQGLPCKLCYVRHTNKLISRKSFFSSQNGRSEAEHSVNRPQGLPCVFSFISAYFHKSNTNIGYYYNRSREGAHTDRLLPFIAFIKSLRSFTPVVVSSGPFAADKSILRNILTPIFRGSPNNPIS